MGASTKKRHSARLPPFDFRSLPALAAYITRVTAEQRNFRRYVIREQERDLYHHDKYVISIAEDGEITVREGRGGEVPEDKLPKPEEQEAIKAECATAKWPSWLPANEAKLAELRSMLRAESGIIPTLFVYRDPKVKGQILYVQQRIIGKDGNKVDLPWTFWKTENALGWDRMEPEGLLPLYGLDRLKDAAEVFIHEGAKTAKHVQAMCDVLNGEHSELSDLEEKVARDARNACPLSWIERLQHAAHIGWPGGAPNPHRVDWTPITTLSPHTSVTLVCDNDPSGENAAPFISRTLKRRMSVVRFGESFPRKFDLADAFPETLFAERKGHKVYVGPTLEQSTEPATWATINKDRLRPEFIEEWHYTVKPAAFVNRSNLQRRYDESEFNINVAPFSDVPNVAALLRRYPSAKAETLI
jgi:hypothetical protein